MQASQIQQALQLHSNSTTLSVAQVQQILGNASVTFAQLLYVTKPRLAAKHATEDIVKVSCANVILCSNIKAHTSVYANRVKRTAAKYPDNNPAAVAAFVPQATYYKHTSCYSIVEHVEHAGKFYLYAIYNSAKSAFVRNGVRASREDIAAYMTPSGARELLSTGDPVHNVKHNITHECRVRVIALSNIVAITARKQILSV